MRGGALLGLVVLAACSGTGADIEIFANDDVVAVEVFIGSQYCDECAYGIGWTDGQPAPAQRFQSAEDQVWLSVVDPGESIGLRAMAEKDGSVWRLHLSADRDQNAAKIFIVGYDANKTPVALGKIDEEIPINSEIHWRVTLDPAGRAELVDMSPPDDTEPPVRVATWGRDDDLSMTASRCMVAQTWTGNGWHGTYIVPESDPDCDNEVVECDPYYFNLNQSGGICAGRGDTTGDGACRLGTTTCEDGTSETHTCNVRATPPTVCVPDGICEHCTGPYGLRQCVVDAVKRDLVARASCRFSGAIDGAACGRGYVGSMGYLYLPYPCQSIEVRSLGNVLAPSATKMVRVGETADFTIELDPGAAVNTCKVYVTFEAGFVPSGDSNTVILAVTPTSSNTTTILVPLEIVFESFHVDCGQQQTPQQCEASPLEVDGSRACGY